MLTPNLRLHLGVSFPLTQATKGTLNLMSTYFFPKADGPPCSRNKSYLNTSCGGRPRRHGKPLDDEIVAVGHGDDAQVISVAQSDVTPAAPAPHDVRVCHGEAVRL